VILTAFRELCRDAHFQEREGPGYVSEAWFIIRSGCDRFVLRSDGGRTAGRQWPGQR